MPGKLRKASKYSPVNDSSDTRLPVHNDEAFKHGIHFDAKYIGTLDVTRPSSRTEIVTAMRKIRLEFKMKKVKKQKIQIVVSTSGVKVITTDSKKARKGNADWENDHDVLMSHPIHKVFYVSHDSTDLQIFSYITKDPATGSFSCSVFKAKKKDQAMYIVRTIGQAFEVCHKLALQAKEKHAVANAENPQQKSALPKQELELNIKEEEPKASQTEVKPSNNAPVPTPVPPPLVISEEKPPEQPAQQEPTTPRTPVPPSSPLPSSLPPSPQVSQSQSKVMSPPQLQKDEMHNDDISFWAMEGQQNTSTTEESAISSSHPILPASGPLTLQYLQKVHEQQINLQRQETQVAKAQVKILKQQLISETEVRKEAQGQVQTLMQQNKELILTMQQLVRQIHSQAGTLTTTTSNQTHVAQQVLSATTSALQVQTDSQVTTYGQQQLMSAWNQAQTCPDSPVRDNPVAASTPHKTATGIPVYSNISPFKSTASIPQLPPPPKNVATRKSSRSGSVASNHSQNSSPITERSNLPPPSPRFNTIPVPIVSPDVSFDKDRRRPLPDEFLQLAYNTSVTSPLPSTDDQEFDELRKDDAKQVDINNVSSTSQSGAVTVCLLQGQQIIENNVAQSRNSIAEGFTPKARVKALNGNSNIKPTQSENVPPR